MPAHVSPRRSSHRASRARSRRSKPGLAEPVLRVGNLDAQRDVTDVRDIVRGYEVLVARGRQRVPYNLCSGQAYRVGDLLDLLLEMSRVEVRVEQDPSRLRPSDNPLVQGDASRITADTGWRAEITIEQTLSDLLDWWRAQVAASHGGRQ